MTREVLPPTGRMYRALRNQKRPLGTALAEWIENSLGEQRGNADRVWIIVNQRGLAIMDDGQAPERLGDVVQIGAGAISGGFDTGRFGWGGSIAQLTFARRAEMWALRADGMMAHDSVDWDRVVEHEEHPAVDSTWRSARSVPKELKELGHGFLLVMHMQSGKVLSSEPIRRHIAREFSAGLRAGKRIFWIEKGKEIEIEPWSPPDLSDVVRARFTVGDGLTVDLEAGWSDVLSPAEQGLELEYGPRRLARIKEPFTGYQGPTIFGWLRLSGTPWLELFESEKTGIADDRVRTMIERRAREILTPLMDELRELQRDSALVEIAGDVAAALNKLQSKTRGDGGEKPGWETTTWKAQADSPTKQKKRDGQPPEQRQPGERRILISGDSTLGSRPWEIKCPVKDDWTIQINDGIDLLRRALEERPPDRALVLQILAHAIAFQIVRDNNVVRFGLFSREEYDDLELKYGDEVELAVFQRLLTAVSAS